MRSSVHTLTVALSWQVTIWVGSVEHQATPVTSPALPCSTCGGFCGFATCTDVTWHCNEYNFACNTQHEHKIWPCCSARQTSFFLTMPESIGVGLCSHEKLQSQPLLARYCCA